MCFLIQVYMKIHRHWLLNTFVSLKHVQCLQIKFVPHRKHAASIKKTFWFMLLRKNRCYY